jgi:hypothetical protein
MATAWQLYLLFWRGKPKKLKIPRCMKLVFFHHGFGVKHKRARQK